MTEDETADWPIQTVNWHLLLMLKSKRITEGRVTKPERWWGWDIGWSNTSTNTVLSVLIHKWVDRLTDTDSELAFAPDAEVKENWLISQLFQRQWKWVDKVTNWRMSRFCHQRSVRLYTQPHAQTYRHDTHPTADRCTGMCVCEWTELYILVFTAASFHI